jgi:hypothetical protein
MRTTILKLLPRDLENPIIENDAFLSSDQAPNKDQIGGDSETILVSCTCNAYQELFDIIQTTFSVKQYEYLINQIQKYHLTDEHWSKLKTLLDSCSL